MFWIGNAFEGIARGTRIAIWLGIVLALVASHGCVAVIAWNAKGDRVAAAELNEVKAEAQSAGEQRREHARIDAEVITEGARREAAQEQTFREIREEIPNVAQPVRPVVAVTPDCPACDCRLGAGFVRVWNDANAATVPVPAAAAGAAQAIARPDPAAAEPDAVTVSAEDVLTNHVDNAQIHATNRGQCEDLLAWHHKQQERTP